MLIAVGSTNPVKIEAARKAFQKLYKGKKNRVKGVEVTSSVSKQPMSDAECIKGAQTRAKIACKLSNADYGVGIEGGLQKIGRRWFDCGWVVVVNKEGVEGIGSSIRMHTPPKMMRMVKKGLELGEVDDILFNMENSKQKLGHFGLMTDNLVPREKAYVDAVISAFSSFLHPEVFE